ncbi:branched-chain amino acid ABC transporter permease [Natronomonas marina]|jgi:branched-chain amino acid transport system permease protein|uniref:branched-chain amino acid ABC transporter permease n=1 Tax=Natronomonas marina TaxID=2961939 RepID=UPI0020C97161|nr:branched-chain amino acid ABC transporter permease [Natronomonas marina]
MTAAVAAVDAVPLFAPVDIGIRAVSKAALYIVIASGLSLIFGLMGVLNFAHGSLTMIGAYLGGAIMVAAVSSGTSGIARFALFFVAVAAVFAVLTAFGAGVELALIRPIYDREPLFQILLTFGLVLVLDEAARIVVTLAGLQPQTTWQDAVGTAPAFFARRYEILGVNTRWALFAFEALVGLLLVVGVFLFLNRTRYGLYIRAGSEDPEMTQALGIDIRRAFTVVFGVGAGLAGMAGVLLMWDPRFGATVPLSVETLLIAFIVVIIGGLGSFKGTVVAGMLVGLVDALMSWLFINVVDFPGLPELVLFAVLVTVLIVRPTGLFGVEEVGGH